MATSDYIISFTDPTNGSLTIKQKTTNGTVLPTVPEPYVTYAVGADTSIVLQGRYVPNWGDNLQEAIVHILENFAGASQPLHPIEGQLWFAVYRYWYDAINNRWYVFNKATGEWLIIRGDSEPIVPGGPYNYSSSVIFSQTTTPTTTSGNYWFNTSNQKLFLQYTLADVNQTFWIECIYKNDNISPSAPALDEVPERYLRVYTGQEWTNVNSVRASAKEPQNPEPGMIWVNTGVTVSGTPQVNVWDADNTQWVDIGATLLATGGIFQQLVQFVGGAEVTTLPTNTSSIVNSGHLETRLTTVQANLTQAFDNRWSTGLITDLPANGFTITGLRNPSALTEAVPFGFADGRYIRTGQALVNFQSVGITTQLDMNSTKIINLATPTSNFDASTKKYVDDRIALLSSGGLTLNASSIFNDSSSYVPQTNVAQVIDEIAGDIGTLTTNVGNMQTTVTTLNTVTVPGVQTDVLALDSRVTAIEGGSGASLLLAGGTMDVGATITLQLTNAEITDNGHVVHKQYVDTAILGTTIRLDTAETNIANLQIQGDGNALIIGTLTTDVTTLTTTTVPGLASAIGVLQDDVIDSATMNPTTGAITLTRHDATTIPVTNSGFPASSSVAYAPIINGVVSKTATTQPTNVDAGLDTLEQVIDRQTSVCRLFTQLIPLTVTGYTTNTIVVAGDHTAKFFTTANVEIAGSANNNGTYVVQSSAFATGNTTITLTTSTLTAVPVDGTVVAKSLKTPNYIAGSNKLVVFAQKLKSISDIQGMLRLTFNTTLRDPLTGFAAQIYASTITVDGVIHTVTIDNSANAFANLSAVVTSLNTQLSGAAYATYDSELKQLFVVSDSHGITSTIVVAPGGTEIFANLANVTLSETLTPVVEDYFERGSYRKTPQPQTIIDLATAPTVLTKFELYTLGDSTQF